MSPDARRAGAVFARVRETVACTLRGWQFDTALRSKAGTAPACTARPDTRAGRTTDPRAAPAGGYRRAIRRASSSRGLIGASLPLHSATSPSSSGTN